MKLSLPLPRREILIVAGAALLLVTLTAVISGIVAHARLARRASANLVATRPAANRSSPVRPVDEFPAAEDFVLPAPSAPDQTLVYQPFRPRERRWTAEEVSKYWVAPRSIAVDVLGALNDQGVERLFQTIP